MDDVAAGAGVTKPVLYQHFANKRSLFCELLDDVGGRLLARLAEATHEATTGRQRVEAGFAAYFSFVSANPAAFRLLFGASVRNDPEFASHARHSLDAAAEAISSLIDVPLPDEHRLVLAHAVVGIAEATSRRSIVGDDARPPEPEQLAAWVAELTWFGLRGIRGDFSDDPRP